MGKQNKLITDFYELKASQLMDKRVWDLPIIEENEDISQVLSILSSRNHIWVVKNKVNKELIGVITEHDVLNILAPKDIPTYAFGMPDLRSIQYGTAKSVGDIMTQKVVICDPEEKIIDALIRMAEYKLRRLPVVKDKQLIGELTLNQLIRKYYDATQYNTMVDWKGE